MKKIIALIGLVFVCAVQAQDFPIYDYQAVSMTAFPTVVTGQSSNILAVLDCRKAQNVAIQTSFKLQGAGTGNVTFTLSPSVDGSNFDTAATNKVQFLVAGNGTTTVIASTNLAVKGFGYYRLDSIANAAGDNLTNITFRYSLKLNAP